MLARVRWLDRLLELAEQLFILVVSADPEPDNHVTFHDAYGSPIKIDAYLALS